MYFSIFKSISPQQINETVSFLACWYKSTKIKIWFKIFWSGMVKNGYGQSGLWTLKLTVSQEWNDGNNWFFVCCYKFMQIKKVTKKVRVWHGQIGCGLSCDRTLKLTLIIEWTDGINWIFASWYRFTKIKSWPKIKWVSMVKNWCGQSGHGTLKLTLSPKWADGINSFLHVVTISEKLKVDSMIFGWTWTKMTATFLVHETLKSAVSW